MSDPLRIMAASDDSTNISDLSTIEKTAAAGLYPIEYTVYYRGTYVMSVTGADGQVNARTNWDCASLTQTSTSSIAPSRAAEFQVMYAACSKPHACRKRKA